jgi:serine O-acetyltransferase
MLCGADSHEDIKRADKTYPDIGKILDVLITPSNGKERNIPLPTTDMPSPPELARMMELIRAVVYPGFFGAGGIGELSTRRHMSSGLDDIFRILTEQIRLGMCFTGHNTTLSQGLHRKSP